jgi:type IV pilus assembly protein PilE
MKPEQNLFTKKLPAFTLAEVLIVMVIIGILVLMVLPNLLPTVTRAKTQEAKIQLGYLQELEKNYFYEHSRYSKDLEEIGFVQQPLATDTKEGANYRIDITSATATTFTATATAVRDFNGNGTFNVWQIDQDKSLKEITPD